MTFVINNIEIEGALTVNGIDVTSAVQSVGEKVANAGNAVSYAAGLNGDRPVVGTVGTFYYSSDQGIVAFDNGAVWNNILPAYSGDVSSTLGGTSLTLATVNATVGSFGSTTEVPVVTANNKGLITNITTAALSSSSVGLGNVTNLLQVINDGNAVSYALGTNGSKPAAGTSGRQYYSTDQGITYYDNGSVWAAELPAYSGDVTSTLGGTSLTLATVNSNVGTYNNVTVNAKGLVTAASNVSYLTSNQSITLSGDFTGTGTTSITGTLATVNSNVGTYNNVTVNAKGLVTSASNVNYLNDSGLNGILVRTSANNTAARTLVGTLNQIVVTNGDGVSLNPIFKLSDNTHLPGTGSAWIPYGTTAERPGIVSGIRYNTSIPQFECGLNGAFVPFGKVIQYISGIIPTTTGTTILPYDTTTPTNTEGFQIFSTTVTPTYDNSNIVVIFNIYSACSFSLSTIVTALFKNAEAISVAAARPGIASASSCLGITKTFVSLSTAPITLSARVGPSAASTVYVNRGNTETMGLLTTSYIIMEII